MNNPFQEKLDAINSYTIFLHNYPYLKPNSNDPSRYRIFLIVYLIFGLRTIITVKKYEQSFPRNHGAYK